MTEDFESFFERNRETESRVHTELTERSRERITHVLTVPDFAAANALDPVIAKAGKSGVPDEAAKAAKTTNCVSIDFSTELHEEIVMESESSLVLSYLEYLFIEQVDDKSTASDSLWLGKYLDELKDIFETEGLLWRVNEISEDKSGVIKFEPLESEAMLETDSEIQSLAEEDLWQEPLRGYNSAYERYLDGDYDEVLIKKLYNSVEEVLKEICVDQEGWINDRDRPHSVYLEELNERGVYDANGITAPEMNDLLQGLERLVSKLGNDRKQRHNYIDRTYCTLLLHQTGAFLYFIINRYSDYSRD